jgi:hypothetical protein
MVPPNPSGCCLPEIVLLLGCQAAGVVVEMEKQATRTSQTKVCAAGFQETEPRLTTE